MSCNGGVCKAGVPTCDPAKCSDNNACTTDACSAAGKCESTPVADGTACGNSLACKVGSCVSTGAGGHYCDTHCGAEGTGCYCDAECKKFGDCCDASGKAKAGATCVGSTCAQCK
jgi:hypothetical protein